MPAAAGTRGDPDVFANVLARLPSAAFRDCRWIDLFQNSLSIKLYVNLEKSFLQKPDFLTVAFYNSLADCIEAFYPT